MKPSTSILCRHKTGGCLYTNLRTQHKRKKRLRRKPRRGLITNKPDTIQTKIINAPAPYKELVHTITSDNGKEFTNHQFIAQKLPTDYVFTDPYSS